MGRYVAPVARARSVYACTECGGQQPRWLGRCPECGAWSTLVEEAVGVPGAVTSAPGLQVGSVAAGKPQRLGEILADGEARIGTGIA